MYDLDGDGFVGLRDLRFVFGRLVGQVFNPDPCPDIRAKRDQFHCKMEEKDPIPIQKCPL